MNRIILTATLLLAAAWLEVGGDAFVRSGLHARGGVRIAWFIVGAIVLFAYGIFVNSVPVDFGRSLGIYVVFFFAVAQIVNFLVFHQLPSPSVLVGGACIVLGGIIMTVR